MIVAVFQCVNSGIVRGEAKEAEPTMQDDGYTSIPETEATPLVTLIHNRNASPSRPSVSRRVSGFLHE